MRLLVASLMLLSFAAIAGEQTAPAAPAEPPAKLEAAPAPLPVAAASAPGRKRVCERETTVGTRFARTVCRDETTQTENEHALDDLRNQVRPAAPSQQSH